MRASRRQAPRRRSSGAQSRTSGLRGPALAALTLSALLAAGGGTAAAHDFYSNTSDPQTRLACCGGDDCAPIRSRDVEERPGGFRYLPTGEFIPYRRVQRSPDWSFHRCVYRQTISQGAGRLYRSGETRCFFAPPGLM